MLNDGTRSGTENRTAGRSTRAGAVGTPGLDAARTDLQATARGGLVLANVEEEVLQSGIDRLVELGWRQVPQVRVSCSGSRRRRRAR